MRHRLCCHVSPQPDPSPAFCACRLCNLCCGDDHTWIGGFHCAHTSKLRRAMERADRHRKGPLRSRVSLSGQDPKRLGRLRRHGSFHGERQGRRERDRFGHRRAWSPESQRHRSYVGIRWLRNLGCRRVLGLLDGRTPAVSLSPASKRLVKISPSRWLSRGALCCAALLRFAPPAPLSRCGSRGTRRSSSRSHFALIARKKRTSSDERIADKPADCSWSREPTQPFVIIPQRKRASA